ncbi:ribbon-helix-helix protein, CopG family [Patescibacteria group bacterium AH-259-L07]|nr:ribbon-helix-helix protein, CopG family [Patescibacteria group bacterium AH-259-L07]
MSNNSTRTQIILPQELRKKIEEARQATGESMAEYLRRAVTERIKHEKANKVNLKKLSQEVVGAVKKSSWEGIDIKKWQREMREDRDNL